MDPDANLQEQIEIADQLLQNEYASREDELAASLRLAELVLALDQWLTHRGFFPECWTHE